MTALLVAFGCWGIGAVAALLLRRRAVAGTVLGAAGALGGAAAAVLAGSRALAATGAATWTTAWPVPAGALALRLDPLAAAFLLPIAVIGGLCAVYGVAYLRHHAHGATGAPRIGASLAAYDLLLLGMAVVATANNLLLLLVAWELMTLSSWALVVSDHGSRAVRGAGLQYLVAGHVATAALVLLALFLAAGSGSFAIPSAAVHAAAPAGLLFMLALVGFGTKAGVVPMHVWLPDAHPAAPSHVSALMSAVMITMGFYGLARFLPLLGAPALWWGGLLLALGALGASGGIAFALAQRDAKRVLAYSTVENAGIVTMAMGLGLLATALGQPLLAGLAWSAALLHLWNHALAKTLLFLGFGAAAQAAGSRDLDRLGGLLARWPLAGGALLVGAAAIASLPGLNVFASEWLLLRTLLTGALALRGAAQVVVLAAVVVLALTGGLAVLCFTRLAGVALLGTPRTEAAARAPRPGWAIAAPMVLLAGACVLFAAVPARIAAALGTAVRVAAPGAEPARVRAVLAPVGWLLPIVAAAVATVLLVRAALGALRARGGAAVRAPTWGCGYPAPTPAMQYTSTSFGEPVTRILQPVLRTETVDGGFGVASATTESSPAASPGSGVGGPPLVEAAWPLARHWESATPDRVLVAVWLPIVAAVGRVGTRLRRLYRPRVTTSLLYIVATVVVMLALLFLPGMRS